MDTSNAITKIANIVIKVNEFIDTMKDTYDKYAIKINGYIDKLEEIINTAIDKINNGAQGIEDWIRPKLKNAIKKVQDALDNLKKKIDDIIDGIKTWYDNIITKIKVSVIKAVAAKMGMELPDEAVMALADAIPHPDITSFIPEFNLEIPIPEIYLGRINKMEFKRLPILDPDNIEKYGKKKEENKKNN
jgi:hypothetical protein